MDIAQGNIVTQEMVDQLRIGMTRSQVRFVLGTPLVSDPFHANRWDYYYSYFKGMEKSTETRHIVMIFQDDKLAAIEGTLPDETASGTATTQTP
jgi:outer membrane protein assembly factor BamE